MKIFLLLILSMSIVSCANLNRNTILREPASPRDGDLTRGNGNIGNGGYGVVCYDKDKKIIKSVELLDIYEWKIKGIIFDQSFVFQEPSEYGEPSYESRFAKSIERLDFKGSYGWNKKDIALDMRQIAFYKTVLPDDVDFAEKSKDALPEFIQTNCSIEQIAKYREENRIYLVKKFWDKLDNLNKFALMLHEAVYKFRRKAFGDTSSIYSRELVAYLLADKIKSSSFDINEGIKRLMYRKVELALEACKGSRDGNVPGTRILEGDYSNANNCEVGLDGGDTGKIMTLTFKCPDRKYTIGFDKTYDVRDSEAGPGGVWDITTSREKDYFLKRKSLCKFEITSKKSYYFIRHCSLLDDFPECKNYNGSPRIFEGEYVFKGKTSSEYSPYPYK